MPKRYHYTKKTGRPTKYDPAYCQQLIKFFTLPHWTVGAFGKLIPTTPPFFSAFARSIQVDDTTLDEWAKHHAEFSLAIKAARKLQEEHLVACGFAGASNPAMTIFLLKNNHGYTDRPTEASPNINVSVNVTVFDTLKQVAAHRGVALQGASRDNGHTDTRAA